MGLIYLDLAEKTIKGLLYLNLVESKPMGSSTSILLKI